MENYEKKYKEALETARKINSGEGVAGLKDWSTLEVIFPELRKSKDELIKEELIHFLETCQDTRFVVNRKCDKWIEWLEKQNKPQVRTGNEWVNTVDNACNHRYVEEYAHGEYCHEQSFKWGFQEGVDWLEKYPIFNMPRIEFKVGDWVIFKCGTPESVYKVEKLENYEYTLEHFLGGSMPLPFGSQSLLRHWTIQDAKKGDILQANKCTLIFDSLAKDIDGNTVISSWYYCNTKTFYGMGTCKPDLWVINGVTPATKEQRDLLFQKMHETGYIWDSNKKELIRYE